MGELLNLGLTNRSILIVRFKSLGAAYQAAQLASSEISLLEIFPIGTCGHVIFSSQASMSNFAKELSSGLSTEIISSHFLPECSQKLLQAYQSTSLGVLHNTLWVAESEYIGPLFELAEKALKKNFELLDLRMLRGADSSSYLFLSHSEKPQLDVVKDVKITMIENPNENIRQLFSINP